MCSRACTGCRAHSQGQGSQQKHRGAQGPGHVGLEGMRARSGSGRLYFKHGAGCFDIY